jgi:hypothetical protein
MSAPVYHQIDCPKIGSAAAGANEVARYGVNTLPVKLLIERVTFVPDTAVTADASNTGTLTIKAGDTTIATLTTNVAQGNLVAGTVYSLTLTGSGTDLEVSPLETVSVAKTFANTGAVLSGLVSFSCTEIRS